MFLGIRRGPQRGRTRYLGRTYRPQVEAMEARLALSLGPPVIIPTITVDNQDGVATSSNNLLTAVVWVDHNAAPNEGVIWLEYYDLSGKPFSGPYLVDDSRGWADSEPVVAITQHNGICDATAVWTRTNQFGQKDIVGSSNNAGPPRPIAVTGKAEYHPSIAVLPGNNLLVTYTLDSGNNKDVMAAKFDLALDPLTTFKVAAGATLNEQAASVASAPDGRFAIAYQVGKQSAPPNYDIALARYAANGALIDVKTIANTADEETAPSVSLDDGFNALVAYQSQPFFQIVQGATYHNIYAKRVSVYGVIGGAIPIATSTLDETNPVVALVHKAGNGMFVVAYDTVDPRFVFSSPTVIVKEYGGNNTLQTTYNVASPSDRPGLSIDPFGDYFLVYHTSASIPADPGGGVRLRHGFL
jgi:hypothetical protein